MSLAKAVLSGTVYRSPEKRFTGNDVAVTSFTLLVDEKEQSIIRVIARGNLAETVESAISKGDGIVVEGRLQMTAVKANDGTERKVMELDLSSFDSLNSSQPSSSPIANKQNDVVKFAEVEENDILIGEEEIPF